jgi:uncharacterized protein YjbJ (UPF0337 family)
MLEEYDMDRDRFVASAKQVRGAVELVIGKAVAYAELVSDGKADRIGGKVQNAVGRHDAVLEGICARLRDSLPAIEITIEYFPARRMPVRVEKMRQDETVELLSDSSGS